MKNPPGILVVPQFACFARAIPIVAIWAFAASSAAPVPEILGICLGLSRSDVKDILEKNGVPVTKTSIGLISVSRPRSAEDEIKKVRFLFEDDQLYKIVVFFQIPEQEPTAASLLALYARRKDRLTAQHGSPSTCINEMNVPAPERLHEWTSRGRAYQQCSWDIPDQARITRWLYGEDSGIALSTVYETLKK